MHRFLLVLACFFFAVVACLPPPDSVVPEDDHYAKHDTADLSLMSSTKLRVAASLAPKKKPSRPSRKPKWKPRAQPTCADKKNPRKDLCSKYATLTACYDSESLLRFRLKAKAGKSRSLKPAAASQELLISRRGKSRKLAREEAIAKWMQGSCCSTCRKKLLEFLRPRRTKKSRRLKPRTKIRANARTAALLLKTNKRSAGTKTREALKKDFNGCRDHKRDCRKRVKAVNNLCNTQGHLNRLCCKSCKKGLEKVAESKKSFKKGQ